MFNYQKQKCNKSTILQYLTNFNNISTNHQSSEFKVIQSEQKVLIAVKRYLRRKEWIESWMEKLNEVNCCEIFPDYSLEHLRRCMDLMDWRCILDCHNMISFCQLTTDCRPSLHSMSICFWVSWQILFKLIVIVEVCYGITIGLT